MRGEILPRVRLVVVLGVAAQDVLRHDRVADHNKTLGSEAELVDLWFF